MKLLLNTRHFKTDTSFSLSSHWKGEYCYPNFIEDDIETQDVDTLAQGDPAKESMWVDKGLGFPCHVPSCFLLLGILEHCFYARVQRFLKGLKGSIRANGIVSSFKRPIICLNFRLWPGEQGDTSQPWVGVDRNFRSKYWACCGVGYKGQGPPWLTTAVPLPGMCHRGMAVACKKARRRHASCQVENVKDNKDYSWKNFIGLQRARSRGLGMSYNTQRGPPKPYCTGNRSHACVLTRRTWKNEFKSKQCMEHYF